MNSLSNIVQLQDLPDELILAIMNKVKPQALLLCSIITIGNNRLEELALDKCHSIDLTFACYESLYGSLIEGFYINVMPRISNNIQSLTLDLQDVPNIITFAEKNCNGILPNLTHLKIMFGNECPQTGARFTLSGNIHSVLRGKPLYSTIPEFFWVDGSICEEILSNFRCSKLMHSIVSFELDDICVLPDVFNNGELFFPESIQLTHIRITLTRFDHCVHLLSQLGQQLYSFSVNIVYAFEYESDLISEIRSISCPSLKELKMTIYRTITIYEECFVPLLQRLSNVEHLTLLLAVDLTKSTFNHFLDGTYLEEHIVSYMPYLKQLNFHIRSILKDTSHVDIDAIRQSFIKQQQPVECAVEYFNNNYGQCHIYSIPFIGTHLDFISNRFPLFDTNKRFSMITRLLLFDDVKPFESVFFTRISQALPNLKTLEIVNELEQQEKTISMTNSFAHLSTLILLDIDMDYAQQFLCRTDLRCLKELAIDNDILLAIIDQDHQQARDNCFKVEVLRISGSIRHVVDIIRNFFPQCYYIKPQIK